MKYLLAFGMLSLLLTGCDNTDGTDDSSLLDMYEDAEEVDGAEGDELTDQEEIDSIVGPTEIPDDLLIPE